MIFLVCLSDREEIDTSKGKIGPFEEGDITKIPKKTAKALLNGNDFARWAWRCPGCQEIVRRDTPEEPAVCPNPNCDRKSLNAMHPTEHWEIGDLLIDHYDYLTTTDNEETFVFKEGKYHSEMAESQIKSEVKKLQPRCRYNLQRETVKHINSKTYIDRKELGLSRRYQAVENGILDIKKEEVRERKRDERPLSKLPVKFDPEADCPRIKEFHEEVLNDEDIPTIQEATGYCLWKGYPIHKALMLFGSGRNGKSTLLSLITALLGENNISTPSLQDLIKNRFAKAKLYGKLANIHADIPTKKLYSTGAFKMLTGNDLIYADIKHKESFTFRNHAKLFFSTNELPQSEDTTPAFFSRWIIIDFPNFFPDDDPDTDPTIVTKLTEDEEEMSGYLNWALKGLERLVKNHKFTTSKNREEIEEEWIAETDSLTAFVSKRCKRDLENVITKDVFYNAYTNFCDSKEIRAEEKGMVGRRLPKIIPYVSGERKPIEGRTQRCWVGVSLPNEGKEEQAISQEELVKEVMRTCEESDVFGPYIFEILEEVKERTGAPKKKIQETIDKLEESGKINVQRLIE